MKQEIKEMWVQALESGEYEQGHQYLRTHDDKFCCLGVLCDLAVKQGLARWVMGTDRSWVCESTEGTDWNQAVLPSFIKEWAGLEDENPYVGHFVSSTNQVIRTLAELNDDGRSFSFITSVIEGML